MARTIEMAVFGLSGILARSSGLGAGHLLEGTLV
jgi:hypothetical protein